MRSPGSSTGERFGSAWMTGRGSEEGVGHLTPRSHARTCIGAERSPLIQLDRQLDEPKASSSLRATVFLALLPGSRSVLRLTNLNNNSYL